MWFAINLVMVLGIFVCISLLISLCILTVTNALFMSNATVMVHTGRSKLVAMVLFMLYNAVSV